MVANTETLRVYKVSASTTPTNEPLNTGTHYSLRFFPTVVFCVNIDIPDELFKSAARVIAELNVNMKAVQVTSEIVLPKGITLKEGKQSKQKETDGIAPLTTSVAHGESATQLQSRLPTQE